MTAPRFNPGQVVASKYSIRASLGYGGATATYTAVLAPGRDVVVKLFSPQLATRGDVLGALQQVAAVTNALQDTTGAVIESGFDPQTGAPFMVIDLAAVPSLAQTVERGTLPANEVVLIARGIARAVDAAHAQRLAHGALKPQNVFVGPGPQRQVRVVDFGVAIARAALPTNEGFAIAAPWMAPEQMQGGPGGPASDVFSAALVAFFAATAKSYWRSCQGPTPDLGAWQQEIGAPREPASARARQLGATLPPSFDAAFARAFSLNPAERFASVGEFAEALASATVAPKQMAMTMPLTAVPQAAQDMFRQMGQQGAPPPGLQPGAGGAGGSTLSVGSPLDNPWPAPPQGQMPQMQQPPAQPMPMLQGPPAMAQQAYMPQPNPGMMAPAASQSYGPPPESVTLPKSRSGLWIVLTLVVLVLGAGVAVLVVMLGRRGAVAPTADTPAQATHATAPPPAPVASVSAAASATAPPPVETSDAAPAIATLQASADAGAAPGALAQAQDAGAADQPVALLTILCMPDCDSVKIDDKALDTTDAGLVPPEPLQLPPGPHTLAVGRAAYMGQTRKVNLKAGQKLKETFYMTKPGAAAVAKPCGKFLERCPN